MTEHLRFDYAPPRAARDSAWSLVGFALALVAAVFSGWSWWSVWRSRRQGATSVSIGVSPLYYMIVTSVAAACVVGIMRGRRRFGLAGLLIVVASVAAMAVLTKGSPW
jgi:hypothetical protein